LGAEGGVAAAAGEDDGDGAGARATARVDSSRSADGRAGGMAPGC
jgi:hypothetical protein